MVVDREIGGVDLGEDLVEGGPRRYGHSNRLGFGRVFGLHHGMCRGIEEEECGDGLVGDDEEAIDAYEVSRLEEMNRSRYGVLGVGLWRQIEGPFGGCDDEVVRFLGDGLEIVLQRRPPSNNGLCFEIGEPTVLQHQEHEERRQDCDDPQPQESILAEDDPLDPRHVRPGAVSYGK